MYKNKKNENKFRLKIILNKKFGICEKIAFCKLSQVVNTCTCACSSSA